MSSVNYWFSHYTEQMFNAFDAVQIKEHLSDNEIMSEVREVCGWDIADAYEEWISESKEYA